MYRIWEPSKTVCLFALGKLHTHESTLVSLALLKVILCGNLLRFFKWQFCPEDTIYIHIYLFFFNVSS